MSGPLRIARCLDCGMVWVPLVSYNAETNTHHNLGPLSCPRCASKPKPLKQSKPAEKPSPERQDGKETET